MTVKVKRKDEGMFKGFLCLSLLHESIYEKERQKSDQLQNTKTLKYQDNKFQ